MRFKSILVIAFLLALLAPACARPGDAEIVHVLNRLGYGPRPGDVEAVRTIGIAAWIEQQLHPERIADADVRRRLAHLESLTMTPVQALLSFPPDNLLKRLDELKNREEAQKILAMMPPKDERGKPRQILQELVAAKLIRAVHSPRQLEEVMADFLFNHLNVVWNKGADRVLVTSYERDVIRANAFGKFRDLLLASAKHPAMLYYLDNWLSTAADAPNRGGGSPVTPPTPGGKRKPGLNENYARELMELHTLGVDGGYTQKDVVEVARCFTGWTISQPRRGGAFIFRKALHDDGQKVVLGHVIPAGGGINDGAMVIDILSRHPSTAKFLATKLCRRFVADDPPPALVARVAKVFLQTDGDLRATVRSIVTSPELLSAKYRRAKIKTPFELVASSIRVVGGETDGGFTLLAALNRMGMVPYNCQPPTGYADRADAWVSSGALLERLSFAIALMEGRMTGTRVDAAEGIGLSPFPPTRASPGTLGEQRYLRPDVDALIQALLGGDCSAATRDTLRRAQQENPPLPKLTGLVLGSPEFQRR